MLLLLLTLATVPMYKFNAGDFACVYRVNTTIYIRDRALIRGQHLYYGYDSVGQKWRVSELMLDPGKCYKR